MGAIKAGDLANEWRRAICYVDRFLNRDDSIS